MQRRFEVGAKVYSSQFGVGQVIGAEGIGDAEIVTVRFDASGERRLTLATQTLEPFDSERHRPAAAPAPAPAPAVDPLRESLRDLIRSELGLPEVRMIDRWKGGSLVIRAARADVKPKEIPIDDFFHKIVMVRDRLRVLEQRINAHPGLADAEKVELQQYITRIYGSLTTFNVLFADRDDWFVGQKGE